MPTMKFAYMLQSIANPNKYLLMENDPVWEPADLSSTENIDTYGRRFICEHKLDRAKEIAEKWNNRNFDKPERHVAPVKVLRGFVLAKPNQVKTEKIRNDLVYRQDVYNMLHCAGGTGAKENSWADGWDKAMDEAIDNLKDLKSANA